MASLSIKCPDCSMTFKSSTLLNKHREKFCVGAATTHSDHLRPTSESQIINDKIKEVRDLKERRQKERDLRDIEDYVISEQRDDPHFYSNYLRTKMSMEARSNMSSAATTSSMSIHLPNSESNSPRESRFRELADSHGKHMTQLHTRNAELEKQKEGIRRRLEQLSRQGDAQSAHNPFILDDLKRQEDKNQRTLTELKTQLSQMHAYRQQYIAGGGNDPEILRQTTNMMREAQSLDDRSQHDTPTDAKTGNIGHQVQGLELENHRLHTELLLLQQRNLMAQSSKGSSDTQDEMKLLQKEHLRKLTTLQNEMEILKHQAELERYKRELGVEKTPATDRRSKTPPRRESPPPPVHASPPLHQPVSTYHVGVEEADVPYLMRQGRQDDMGMYSLHPAQYDANAGFVIFYDFVLGLDPTINTCRLAVAIRTADADIGSASILPTIYTDHTGSTLQMPKLYNTSCAVIGAKQPYPSCVARPDLDLVVELQASGVASSHFHLNRLVTRAWTKIQLFDPFHALIAGYYKVPLRLTPLQPELAISHIHNLHKFGECELYYRVIHARDSTQQSLLPIAIQHHPSYRPPPLHQVTPPVQRQQSPQRSIPHVPILPPPLTTPPLTPAYQPRSHPHRSPVPSIRSIPTLPPPPPPPPPSEERTLGLQVHRLKHCDTGEAKVRLTAYYTSTAKPVDSRSNAVTCCTTAIQSDFRHTYHIFGEQEAVFSGVSMQRDMVLLAKVYLKAGTVDDMFDTTATAREEQLIAWTYLPLVVVDDAVSNTSGTIYNPDLMRVNSGTHTLPLYLPSVPLPNHLPLDDRQRPSSWLKYGKATVKIHVSHGSPHAVSPTPSDVSDDGDKTLPTSVWIKHERRRPLTEPYVAGDGFDIYIDGCRFLPDSVTFSRVAGRVLDVNMNVLTPDIFTSVDLDSDIYNPVYEHREEVRKKLVPTATMVLKVYTIGMYEPHLTTVGYALFNLFVESGTDKPATVDSSNVCVNEGAHQLRLYHQGPSPDHPLTESCLRDAGIRYVPCATLLIRVHKVPRGPNKKVPVGEKVPRSEWEALGIWHPMPDYRDRVYYSTKTTPTAGEVMMYNTMNDRAHITARDAINESAQARHTGLDSKKNIDLFIKVGHTWLDSKKNIDLSIKVKIESAQNLPWDNFTLAHSCVNPPAAFYQGPPHVSYDRLTFTQNLDPNSTTSNPIWLDHFTHLPYRAYHRYLTMVIHMQEIEVNTTSDNYKYGLIDQAWTVVPLFTQKYAHTTAFLVPLFSGSPTPEILEQLAHEPTRQWLEKAINSRLIRLLSGASIFVLVADARRVEEVDFPGVTRSVAHVDRGFIPDSLINNYTPTIKGTPLLQIIPDGKVSYEFLAGLGKRFKKLVYKLYEDDTGS